MDHWSAPDVPGDIRAAAWRPGLPAPTEIRVRPELVALLDASPPGGGSSDGASPGSVSCGQAPAVPVVVDDAIPSFPGFEVHRGVRPPAGDGAGGNVVPHG